MDQNDILKIREALQLAMMSGDKQVRDQSTQFLKSVDQNQQFFLILFEIINNKEYGELQNLQAAIYVTKFIQTEYVKVEGTFKFDLQEAMLQSFLNHSIAKVRNQLRVGIMRLIITDFPKSKIFELLIESLTEEKLVQMNIEQITTLTTLYYFVFKALYEDKKNDHKIKQYVVNHFNQKRPLFIAIIQASIQKFQAYFASNPNSLSDYELAINQLSSTVNLSCLRYALKFLNIENLLSIHTQAQFTEFISQIQIIQEVTHLFSTLVNLHGSVEEQEKLLNFIHALRQIIYSYHKYFLNAVCEKRTTAHKCIVVLEYLKSAYFQNSQNLILNNQSFISSQQLNDTSLLDKLNSQPKLVQFFEDECNLIIQSLDFCSELIQVLGFKSVQHLFGDSIDDTCENETVICEYFDQHYFQTVLEFLLRKVLQLNWSQLALISLEPERAFSEDKGSETSGIRQAGVNLLKVLMQSVNEEKMMELLNQLLLKFTSTICTGKQPYSEILERESFYFIMNGLYKDIKNTVEFDDWYVSVLSTELLIDDDNLIPIKVQILNLIYSYLSNSYQITDEIALSLFQTIATLMIDNSQSIYIRLMSMKCFIPLMDSCTDLMMNVDQIMGGVKELFNDCEETESKMLLLDFVQNLIELIKDTSSEFMKPIYQFLSREWQEACDADDSQQLSLKAQIAQVLSQILLKYGLDITQIQFIAQVINSGTEAEELSEIYLIENSCRLMYFFVKELNKKLSDDYPSSMMNLLKLKENDIYTPYEQAVRERELLISEASTLEKLMINFTQKIENIFLTKQNLYHTSLMVIIELINSPFESVAQSIGMTLQKGLTANLDEIKDELFCFIFDALEYLQIVYPLSSAQAVESATLALIGDSIKKGMFNNSMKLYVLRIIGRAFFSNISVGSSLCEKISNTFSEPEFLNNLLHETGQLLEQLKPDLYFYRMQYSCMLSVVQTLLKISNAEGNATLITDLKIRNLIDAYITQLEKILQIIKSSYDKSICSEDHWILTNLQKLLKVEEILDASEVNIQRSNLITKHLRTDKLKKIDFASHTKVFFAQNNLIPSIEIDFDKLSLE